MMERYFRISLPRQFDHLFGDIDAFRLKSFTHQKIDKPSRAATTNIQRMSSALSEGNRLFMLLYTVLTVKPFARPEMNYLVVCFANLNGFHNRKGPPATATCDRHDTQLPWHQCAPWPLRSTTFDLWLSRFHVFRKNDRQMVCPDKTLGDCHTYLCERVCCDPLAPQTDAPAAEQDEG